MQAAETSAESFEKTQGSRLMDEVAGYSINRCMARDVL
jgi:hypothetical protein